RGSSPAPPPPPSPRAGPLFGKIFSRQKLTHPRPPLPACAKTFTRSTNMADPSWHYRPPLSFRAKSRIERLGKPRHGREGRRLSERDVSESNPVALLRAVSRDPSTPLLFAQDDATGC